MKIRRIFLLFLFIVSTLLVNAATIIGKAHDKEKVAVAYATVACYSLPDSTIVSSGIADSTGNFVLSNLDKGTYCVKCSMLGYATAQKEPVQIADGNAAVNIGNIQMEMDAKEMKELLVIAETGSVGAGDKSVYKITDKLISIAPSGIEVLKYIPSVQTNLTQDVLVDGSSNVQYLIDGRRVTDEEVKSLDSRKIEKVELVHNPSSKYDADVTAVINVILKSGIEFGFSGKFNTETHYSDKMLTNSSLQLEYGGKNWRVFVEGRNGYLDVDYNGTDNSYKNNGDVSLQTSDGRFSSIYNSIKSGLDWKINNQNSLFYQVQYKPKYGEISDGSAFTEYYSLLDGSSSENYEIEDENLSSFIKNYFYYKHRFATPEHDIAITADHSYRLQNINSEYVFEDLQRSYETENEKNNVSVSVDYSLPLSSSASLKLGSNFNYQWFDNTFNVDGAFDYEESKTSLYASFDKKWTKFSFQGGLRYEQAEVKITDAAPRSYSSFLPQTSLQYSIADKQKLKLSYRRSINRPMVDRMNPFVEQKDSLHISVGNPELKPAYEDKMELSYTWLFRASVYYRAFSDMLTEVTQLRTDGVYQTFTANAADGCEYGASLGTSLPLQKWLNLNVYGSLFQQEMYAVPTYSVESHSNTGYRANFSAVFSLPKSYTISGMGMLNSPTIYGQTTSRRNAFYGLSVDKKFGKSLSVGLLWINPFSTDYKFKDETTYGSSFKRERDIAADISWLVNAKLTYTFNKGNKLEKRDKPKDADSDEGVGKMF